MLQTYHYTSIGYSINDFYTSIGLLNQHTNAPFRFFNKLCLLFSTLLMALNVIKYLSFMYSKLNMCTKSKLRKRTKIRNRYNQAPHMTHDTNGKVTNSQLNITTESQEVSPFPAGDQKTSIIRCAQKHNTNKTEKTINDPHKKYRLGRVSKILKGLNQFLSAPTASLVQMLIKTHSCLVCMKDP